MMFWTSVKPKMKIKRNQAMADALPMRGVAERVVVDVLDDRHRRLRRAAAGHHEGLGEKLERADRLEKKQEEGGRADHRHRDVAEALPAVCAVDVGRGPDSGGTPCNAARYTTIVNPVFFHRVRMTTDHFEYGGAPQQIRQRRAGRPEQLPEAADRVRQRPGAARISGKRSRRPRWWSRPAESRPAESPRCRGSPGSTPRRCASPSASCSGTIVTI